MLDMAKWSPAISLILFNKTLHDTFQLSQLRPSFLKQIWWPPLAGILLQIKVKQIIESVKCLQILLFAKILH